MVGSGVLGTAQGNFAVWSSWVRQHAKEAASHGFRLSEATESALIFFVADMLFHLILPSHFSDGRDEGEGSFVAMSPDDSAEEGFVTQLNEKLERIPCRSDPAGAVHQVLDMFLKMMVISSGKRPSPRPSVEEGLRDIQGASSGSQFGSETGSDYSSDDYVSEDSGCAPGEDDDAHDFAVKGPSVDLLPILECEELDTNRGGYAPAAREARRICDDVRAGSHGPSPGQAGTQPPFEMDEGMLKFCVVSMSAHAESVHLRLQVPGLFNDAAVAAALGLSFDDPLNISLQFDRRLLQVDCDLIRSRSQPLLAQQVLVRQLPQWTTDKRESDTKPFSYVDKEFSKLYKDDTGGSEAAQGYATDVLLPELVTVFLSHRAYRTSTGARGEPLQNEQMIKCLDFCADMANPFIGLLYFIGSQLRALPTWCPVCWCSLPSSMWRLRTCSKEFCLYKFEELGQGSAIFHEILGSPQVVELEVALAHAAAVSGRDVFEPFPNSFLDGNGLRGRAGWFTDMDANLKTRQSDGDRKHAGPATQTWRPWGSFQQWTPNNNLQLFTLTPNKNLQFSTPNKNLQLLAQIIVSLPPLDTLRECRDEVSLRRKLAYSTYEAHVPLRQTLAYSQCTDHISYGKYVKNLMFKDLNVSYELLRFILSTNRVSIRSLEKSEMLPFDRDVVTHQFVVVHDSPEKEETFQKLRQTAGGSFFAFHGSSLCNWYSILRNGLRSMSRTVYMSSGDSFGQGIYLADTFEFSFSYSMANKFENRTQLLKFGGTLEWPFCVMAICEVVIGSSSQCSENIHVVPPTLQDNVIVRYLLVCRPGDRKTMMGHKITGTTLLSETIGIPGITGITSVAPSKLNLLLSHGARGVADVDLLVHLQDLKLADRKKHMSQLEQQRSTALKILEEDICLTDENSLNKLNGRAQLAKSVEDQKKWRASEGTVMATQAIIKEHRNILKEIHKEKLKASSSGGAAATFLSNISVVIPDESNFYTWHVRLGKQLFKAYPLHEDLCDWGGRREVEEAHVLLEVTFPGRFPFQPPFIRVVYPRFAFHTGHVTVGGSICMELLTESGWNPAFSFEMVLVQIVNSLIEGGGQIDRAAIGQSYSAAEAKMAFERVAAQHGWKISGK